MTPAWSIRRFPWTTNDVVLRGVVVRPHYVDVLDLDDILTGVSMHLVRSTCNDAYVWSHRRVER